MGMSDYACVLLKCTNMRERTAQLETYAVLRNEKEESVYMRKTARERWRLKIGTQVAPPSLLFFLPIRHQRDWGLALLKYALSQTVSTPSRGRGDNLLMPQQCCAMAS